GKQGAIDGAIASPPRTGEQVFDPRAYLRRAHDPVKKVAVQRPKGTTKIDQGEFGAVSWYLLLARQLDPIQALRAVDGWGGDRYAIYRSRGRVCADVAFQGDTATDTDEMARALAAWSAKVSTIHARVRRAGATVVVSSCDPGAGARVTGRDSDTALVLPIVRTDLYTELRKLGAADRQASCFAQRAIEHFTLDQLKDSGTALATPAAQRELAAIASSCR
ncbi:MAG: hypothetical protein JWM05_2833, partial [Acidimicrobiales bacterium]|nr:hypothetical protein [Acidimicrobiales bacterium]